MKVLVAALVDGRLRRMTVGLVGPTEIGFDDAARLVGQVVGKRRPFVGAPIAFHYVMAWLAERLMTVPLLSLAQVRILEEEVVEAAAAVDRLPEDLAPSTAFSSASIRLGLPDPGPFGFADLRWCSQWQRRGPAEIVASR